MAIENTDELAGAPMYVPEKAGDTASLQKIIDFLILHPDRGPEMGFFRSAGVPYNFSDPEESFRLLREHVSDRNIAQRIHWVIHRDIGGLSN